MFLFELQDALLTGDQELIIATKKKYLEQVYLHRKVKTDAAVRLNSNILFIDCMNDL